MFMMGLKLRRSPVPDALVWISTTLVDLESKCIPFYDCYLYKKCIRGGWRLCNGGRLGPQYINTPGSDILAAHLRGRPVPQTWSVYLRLSRECPKYIIWCKFQFLGSTYSFQRGKNIDTWFSRNDTETARISITNNSKKSVFGLVRVCSHWCGWSFYSPWHNQEKLRRFHKLNLNVGLDYNTYFDLAPELGGQWFKLSILSQAWPVVPVKNIIIYKMKSMGPACQAI